MAGTCDLNFNSRICAEKKTSPGFEVNCARGTGATRSDWSRVRRADPGDGVDGACGAVVGHLADGPKRAGFGSAMKPFTGRQERGVDLVPSFQFVERDLRAAFDEHAWAAKLALEKDYVAVPIPANAVFRPAIRAPSVEDVALGRVEVQCARPILVTERPGAVRIRAETVACPLTNAFAHLGSTTSLTSKACASFLLRRHLTTEIPSRIVTLVKKHSATISGDLMSG